MFYLIAFFSCFIGLNASEYPPRFDGVLGGAREDISNCTSNAYFFIPYNPVILEVGGYEGINTANLAKKSPKGRIIVFEPNPRAFQQLLINVQSFKNVSAHNLALNTYSGTAKLHVCHGIYHNNPAQEPLSSLLESTEPFKGPIIDVPCVVLDDWCRNADIDHIDFMQLDVEGYELQILRSSPEILKTVIVICTKTNFSPFRNGTTQFHELRDFLEENGFELLSHWYREGLQGEATFVRKYMYDALFR